ncbi:MAG: glycosyltransferase family 39 protein [Ignavibacteriales bacterium]|nr:glycosyltransferase family 39 protein [Ignavibacteriales bacterium]
MAPLVSNFRQKFKLSHLVLLIIVIAVVLLRLRLLNVPLERDEGEYAYMGQLLLQGISPYQAAYNMKFPGIYFLYAAVMGIFGQTNVAVHGGLFLATIASILLLYLLGKKIRDEWVGVVAAGSYAMLSLSYHVEGLWANAEHFVLPFALTGLLLLQKARDDDKPGALFLSGLAFGFATLIKQHGAFYALCGFICVLHHFYKNIHTDGWRVLKTFLVFIGGGALPLFLAFIYLYIAGVFEKFFFWTFVYAREYVSQYANAQELFLTNFLPLVNSTVLLWILAGTGFLASLFSSHYKKERFFLIVFAASAFFATTPGFFFRPHYFVLFLPAVALLIGIGASFLTSLFSSLQNKNARLMPPVAFTIIAIISPFASHADVLFKFSKEQIARATFGGNPFPEAFAISQFIKQRTSPDDKIAIIGSEPEILFYAHRHSATGYIYMYPLFERQRYAAAMRQEMRWEVESNAPKFLIHTHIQHSWYTKSTGERELELWFSSYANSSYNLIARLEYTPGGEPFALLTDKEVLSKNPTHDYWISIFERK